MNLKERLASYFITGLFLTASPVLSQNGGTFADLGDKYYADSQWDSAEFYYRKATQAYYDEDSIARSLGQAINLLDLFSSQNRLELLKQTIDSLLTDFPDGDDVIMARKAAIYTHLAIYYEIISVRDQAFGYMEKAIAITESLDQPDSMNLSSMYLDLGILFQRDRDYIQALRHYKESLRIMNAAYPEPLELANIHNSIAVAHFYMENYDEALKEYDRCLLLYREVLSPDHPKIAISYNNLAFTKMNLESYDSSLYYHRKALGIRLKTLPENHRQTVSSYNGLGMVYTLTEQYDSAEFYLNKAVKLLKSHNSSRFNYFESRAVFNLAKLNFSRKYFAKAKEYVDSAIELNLPGSVLHDSIYAKIVNIADLTDLLQFKLKVMVESYKQNPSDELLEEGLLVFRQMQDLASYYFNSIRFIDSQLAVIKILEKAYPLGIELDYVKYKSVADVDEKRKWAYAIFHDIEYFKSNILRRNVFKMNKLDISRVDDKILDKEKMLRAQIASIKSSEQSSSDELFQLERDYTNVMDTIEKTDPQFFELKFKSFVPTLDQAIDLSTKSKKLILEYFLASDALYSLLIDGHELELNRVNIDSGFQDRLGLFYSGLSSPGEHGFDNKNDLYGLILSLYEERIRNRDVIIAADGILNQLPFELLSDSKGSYVLENTNLSYTNSVALLLNTGKRTSPSKYKVLAFAPEYDNYEGSDKQIRGDDLTALNWTANEINGIKSYFDVMTMTGDNATKDMFKDNQKKYSIVHFAGHGIVDDKDPMKSRLAFSSLEDSNDSPYLFTQELLGMEIETDLVVLSACKTGVGEFINGEGTLSLARSFFYAGTKSVIMSYWQVDDQSTSQLMQFFYQNLKSGMTKSEALRQAKLEFLETAPPEKQHPFYW
ncbi:MAG: CHAT domain-containing tetratricopeptide repeat protein, partial [Bacteroidota bacterium]